MTHSTEPKRVRLALSTGEIFEGYSFGAPNGGEGEVVFNTAMSGYQESLSDPSYTGQILVQTAPMIGNTGMNARDMESGKIQVAGIVVHEYVDEYSNYRSGDTLGSRLNESGIPGVYGVDTRAIATILRSEGAVQGVISCDDSLSDNELVQQARSAKSMSGTDYASGAGSSEVRDWDASSGSWGHLDTDSNGNQAISIGLIDCGTKDNILRCLVDVGCKPIVLPITTTADQIRTLLMDGKISGVFLSNGPGDPAALTDLISCVRELVTDDRLARFPIYGICLGHQILALAHGASTYKLKFGHRGVNHPIVELSTGRVGITSQNHGFAVDPASCVEVGLRVTHQHLNDDTVAGLSRDDRPIAGMQYHPEASPGPHDASDFFNRFAEAVRGVEASVS